MNVKLFFLGCLVIFSASLWAVDEGEFRGETKAKIEILQKQNNQTNSKIDSLEKDIRDEYKTVTDRQNERIGDIESHFNIFLTILGILAALASYMTFKRSKEMALNEVQEWLEKNGNSIKTEMTKFETELEAFKKQAKEATEQHNNYLTQSKEKIEELEKSMLQEDMGTSQKNELTPDNSSLNQAIKHILSKPQNIYNFDDWNTLAFHSYQQNKFEDALFYWRKILEINEILPSVEARTLLNIAAVLNKLNRKEESLHFHDELIKKFQATTDEVIQELIARSILVKGIILGQLDRNEELLVTFDTLISTFINSQNDKIKEFIAIAQGSKGTLFLKLNKYEKAIEAFNELILQVNDTQTNVILERKAYAFIGKGIALGYFNKQEAINVYTEFINIFKYTENTIIKEKIAQACFYRLRIQLLIKQISDEKLDETTLSILTNNQKYKISYTAAIEACNNQCPHVMRVLLLLTGQQVMERMRSTHIE